MTSVLLSVISLAGPAAASSGPDAPRAAAPEEIAPAPPSRSEAWARRPLALDLNVGLASPLGLTGVSLDYAPARYVSLGGGVGTNLEGLQLASMCRVRLLPMPSGALYIGGGYSQGPFRQNVATRYGLLSAGLWALTAATHGNTSTSWRRWDPARWLNLEMGGEERSTRGFDARGFVGLSALLNAKAQTRVDQAVGAGHTPGVVPFVLYVGAAFGFSL